MSLARRPLDDDELGPEELLTAYSDGRRTALSTAFGPSGVVLLHLVETLRLPIRVYFLDTEQHFPETLEVLEAWRQRLDVDVVRPSPSPELAANGGRLWLRDPDRCCQLRKVLPNVKALAEADLWVVGLRRDQPGRQDTPIYAETTLPGGQPIAKLAPLATWSRGQVWDHILEHDLPYNRLYDQGYPSVGCAPCTVAVGADAGERAGRWAGRTKNECGLHLPSPEESSW